MRRTLVTSLAAFLALAATAQAGTVASRLEFCQGGDYCRYFPNPRLAVTFVDSAGESNQLSLQSRAGEFRMRDTTPLVLDGPFCDPLDPFVVTCGPRPIPGSTFSIDGSSLRAFTGRGDDSAFAEVGSVELGPGDDAGRGHGAIDGGPGKDDIRGFGGAAAFAGGAGEDLLAGGTRRDELDGGGGPDLLFGDDGADELAGRRGNDQLIGGRGRDRIAAGPGNDFVRATDPDRDVVHCGPGDDRAYVGRNDRSIGCERVNRGWPG